jgi:hypothetical protein
MFQLMINASTLARPEIACAHSQKGSSDAVWCGEKLENCENFQLRTNTNAIDVEIVFTIIANITRKRKFQ